MKRSILLLLLVLAGFFSAKVYAGGNGPACAGLTCGRAHWSDEDYQYWSSLRGAIGERSGEVFPNFYRLSYGMLGMLSHPWVSGPLQALEEGLTGLTPTPADENLIRGIRRLPQLAHGMEDLATVATIAGGRARGRGISSTWSSTAKEAEALADTLPEFAPAIPRGVSRGLAYPANAEEVRKLVESGAITFKRLRGTTVEGWEEVRVVALHESRFVGQYNLTHMGTETLDITSLKTFDAYEKGGIATKAVADYLGENPNVRYLSAIVTNRETVRFVDSLIETMHPKELSQMALSMTPLGRIGSKLGDVRLIQLERNPYFSGIGSNPFSPGEGIQNGWNILVELNRAP